MRSIITIFAVVLAAFGSLVSAQDKSGNGSDALNVDYMLRGYFYAGSRVRDKKALGGFGPSNNYPKTVSKEMGVPSDALFLIASPETETVFASKFKGMRVVLVNGTNERLGFAASDSRLYIIQEAVDRDGKWKPVEYLPSSWCGNSYHTVFLDPNEYWEFSAARYTGKFPTKLRFKLSIQKSEKETTSIYSNEFDGSVNPKQFTVQQGHKPTSIMDPYNN